MASKKKAAKEQKIKVTLNGPYLVTGGVPLSEQIILINDDGDPQGWVEGKKYPAQQTYALCRCGMTGNRPFCDSAHMHGW
jgi:CDGSH-type Zn-finger protein